MTRSPQAQTQPAGFEELDRLQLAAEQLAAGLPADDPRRLRLAQLQHANRELAVLREAAAGLGRLPAAQVEVAVEDARAAWQRLLDRLQ